MRTTAALKRACVAVACGALMLGPVLAEDTKGKWQFGFGISYYATTDYIRSNSDVAISDTVAGQSGGVPTVIFVDDRPDQNMLNEPSARDNFKWDFSASYGLTRWLALEMSAGYMKTAVGNIEYFFTDRGKLIGTGSLTTTQFTSTLCGPEGTGQCFRYPGTAGAGSTNKYNLFVPVGDLTEVPVQLSALVRFRPESPLDPYVGLGIGYIFTDMEQGDEFNARAETIAGLNVTTSWGGEVDTGETTGPGTRVEAIPGYTPTPLQAEVSDGFEYHAVGGIDYYFSEHMSMYVDARYVWSQTSIDITTDGSHQVRLSAYYPGRLQTFQVGSAASPNYWEDVGFAGCRHTDGSTCANDGFIATEDSNGNGTIDTLQGEGSGKLYFYPVGPNPDDPQGIWRAADAREVVDCTSGPCPWTANIDPDGYIPHSEDRNNNRYGDRFYLWGVDVCSLPDAASNPLCGPGDIAALPQYVWPGGCGLTAQPYNTPRPEDEGCPRPPGDPPGTVNGRQAPDVSLTPADDTSDTHVIQGGEIKLGGFSLGIGFKFTF
jgi:outer membrane protein W